MSIGPGDEVVCTGTPCVCACGTQHRDGPGYEDYRDPEVGRQYIVGRVGLGICDRCGTRMPLMTPVGRDRLGVPPPYAWPQEWFRPLRHDSDEQELGVHLPVRLGTKKREPVSA